MANDIYSRKVEYGDAFEADKVKIKFSGFGLGLIGQSIQTVYAQILNRIWDLGSNKTFLIAGRTSGNATFQTLSGPSGTVKAFLRKYGDVCQAASNTLDFSYTGAWCRGGGTSDSFSLHNVVVQQATLAVSAQDMMLNNGVAAMFISMS